MVFLSPKKQPGFSMAKRQEHLKRTKKAGKRNSRSYGEPVFQERSCPQNDVAWKALGNGGHRHEPNNAARRLTAQTHFPQASSSHLDTGRPRLLE